MPKIYGKSTIFRPKKLPTLERTSRVDPYGSYFFWIQQPKFHLGLFNWSKTSCRTLGNRVGTGNGSEKPWEKTWEKWQNVGKKWKTLDGKFGNKMGKICTNHW